MVIFVAIFIIGMIFEDFFRTSFGAFLLLILIIVAVFFALWAAFDVLKLIFTALKKDNSSYYSSSSSSSSSNSNPTGSQNKPNKSSASGSSYDYNSKSSREFEDLMTVEDAMKPIQGKKVGGYDYVGTLEVEIRQKKVDI